MQTRLTWQDSWKRLKEIGGKFPRKKPDHPEEIDPPKSDKTHRGARLIGGRFDEIELSGLTLPRVLLSGCRFHAVSFRDTDLRLSRLSGDFIDCDLSGAVLICAHLSGCQFFGCRFVDAVLIGADLRGAKLDHCDFTGCNLIGAKMDRALKPTLELSDEQRRVMVDWRSPDDDSPDDPE